MSHTILRIDSSARHSGSVSRELLDEIIAQFDADTKIIRRDVSEGLPFINEEWVAANFTPPEQRTEAQKQKLTISDELIEEIKEANTLLIGVPIYNFSVPAVLKAWIDQIARAGVTFKYTENGPIGLIAGKKAIVVMVSGGVPIGSEVDFASGYIRQVLSFIGISDVEFVSAERVASNEETAIRAAKEQIDQLGIAGMIA